MQKNNQSRLKMKISILLAMLLPILGIGQTQNVISTQRVFPKMDKVMEFEKALAAHAQKYHNSGKVQWRVFAIQSGPDMGGYHITEGPTSWEDEDTRGDLGTEHMVDWNKNVSAYLTDRQSGGYSVYLDSLSTVALGDFSDKINITHVYPKVGKSENVVSIIKKLKKTWTAAGVTVAVYTASSSGKAQYTVVTRYKQGLKERAAGFRKPFRETYESVNGEGSYAQYLKDLAEYVDESWSELLFMRKDLGSK
ncbi:MAG: hypothetical protein KTQ13_08145 [Ferruginibacter sp.]|nr:hypothetical protein [Chitinophagaceae bacterium]MBP6286814.1 hypothetical protein [Ferruginibacter sp.]MBU9936605.1 hypothetical protein [Ferruginibacter sp.]HQY12507.1 hypothetical protein [Ferruginibacter sp.]